MTSPITSHVDKEVRIVESPHAMRVEEVMVAYKVTKDGLSDLEADQRRVQHGSNTIPEHRRLSIFILLARQFKSWLVILLIIAAAISWYAGESVDAWVITTVIIINAAIGLFHEIRAERAIASLRKLIVDHSKVIRDGQMQSVDATELVPGDLIMLEEGDRVPADARLLQVRNYRTVESALTGESLPSGKRTEPVNAGSPVGDRANMTWKGTFVVSGQAYAIVTHTGSSTQLGQISETLASIRKGRTDFVRKTDRLARTMSIIAIASAIGIFLMGYFVQDLDVREILLVAIAALVAAIPEGLPAVLAIVLAIGARRMAKRNAIIREFTATETLGAVSAILTDKTGTLTMNSLTVRKIFIQGQKIFEISGEGWSHIGSFTQKGLIVDPLSNAALRELLTAAAASNNARFEANDDGEVVSLIGDPTEGALRILAEKAGLVPGDFQEKRLDDLPFSSEHKFRATLVAGDTNVLYVTGAPEVLLDLCVAVHTPAGKEVLTAAKRKSIMERIDRWSGKALRVVALCRKDMQERSTFGIADVSDLEFLGFTGMIDPPRPEVTRAIQQCRQAGIRVIMVTGDHVNTAVAIAQDSGIIDRGGGGAVLALNQSQLERLSESEFDEAIREVSVFARLTPQMKLRIATRLQELGELVAVTGDGVNDAPALKAADVGVAMGIMGTDVARSAADVVLADDNFASIVNAVEEGRVVFMNARQTSTFLVTTNIAESVTLLVAIAMGLPLPLTATQLLWLNLVTDGVTDVSLATEPGHFDLRETGAFSREKNILNREVIPFLAINVVVMALLALGAFNYYMPAGEGVGRTAVFTVMAFTQLFNVFNMRSMRKSVFTIGMFSNRYINVAILVSALLTAAIIFIPQLAGLFRFGVIDPAEFGLLVLLSSLVLWVGEMYKYVRRAVAANK